MVKRSYTFVIAILFVLIAGQLCHAATLGGGARAVGMGGAYTAVADDGAAAYWNPAGITQVKFGLMPTVGVQGKISEIQEVIFNQEFTDLDGYLRVNYGAGLTLRSFGLNVFGEFNGHVAQISGQPVLVLDHVMRSNLTLAKEFTGLLAVGLNAKYVSVKTDMIDALNEVASLGKGSGFAVDLGAMAKVGKLVRVGAVLKDYPLTKIKLDNDQVYELPTRVAFGGAVKVPLLGTLVALDLEKPFKGEETDFLYRFGVEQPIFGFVFLRAGGYKEEENLNFTAGLGLKLGPVVVDTAAALNKENPVYQAALGLKF